MGLEDLSEVDRAYIAGLFDGEGCVSLRDSRSLKLYINISNTDYRIIQWLKRKIGFGEVRRVKRYSHTHKPGYSYRLSCIQARNFLAAILNHLVLKCSQAQLAIAYVDMKRDLRGRASSRSQADAQERIWRSKIREALTNMKKMEFSDE